MKGPEVHLREAWRLAEVENSRRREADWRRHRRGTWNMVAVISFAAAVLALLVWAWPAFAFDYGQAGDPAAGGGLPDEFAVSSELAPPYMAPITVPTSEILVPETETPAGEPLPFGGFLGRAEEMRGGRDVEHCQGFSAPDAHVLSIGMEDNGVPYVFYRHGTYLVLVRYYVDPGAHYDEIIPDWVWRGRTAPGGVLMRVVSQGSGVRSALDEACAWFNGVDL